MVSRWSILSIAALAALTFATVQVEAQSVGTPPIIAPGVNMTAKVTFLPLYIPQEPVPSFHVPVPYADLPPVAGSVDPLQACGVDDWVPVPPLPYDVDPIPCEIYAALDFTTVCETTTARIANDPVVGTHVQGAVATADGALGALGPGYAGKAGDAFYNCRSLLPNLVSLVGHDPSQITVIIQDPPPLDPYPGVLPRTEVPLNATVNEAISGSRAPIVTNTCEVDYPEIDCGTVQILDQSFDPFAAQRDLVRNLPQGGRVETGPHDSSHTTPALGPVGFGGGRVGGNGSCDTPGLPGPQEGTVPGAPVASATPGEPGGDLPGGAQNIIRTVLVPGKDLLQPVSDAEKSKWEEMNDLLVRTVHDLWAKYFWTSGGHPSQTQCSTDTAAGASSVRAADVVAVALP